MGLFRIFNGGCLTASILILACCSDLPSENMAKDVVLHWIRQCADVIDIQNFRKINGREATDKSYIVQVEYDLVPKTDVTLSYGTSPMEMPRSGHEAECVYYNLPMMKRQPGIYASGKSLAHISDAIAFVQTEKGWEPR